ncbi:hypothetical protein LCGC14_1808800 [marine sediment metagenome]|uniref:Uncharacterized protein n=1 Tax=marine sediment metagenome TaxID=412755 RepID=A0A0F9JM17_9ZZZZ
MKIDFSKLQVSKLDGEPVEDFYKDVANVIYKFTEDLDLVDIAIQINRGNIVELRDSDSQKIVRLFESNKIPMFAFARKAVIDFVTLQKQKSNTDEK